jgi:hypothetical protein
LESAAVPAPDAAPALDIATALGDNVVIVFGYAPAGLWGGESVNLPLYVGAPGAGSARDQIVAHRWTKGLT